MNNDPMVKFREVMNPPLPKDMKFCRPKTEVGRRFLDEMNKPASRDKEVITGLFAATVLTVILVCII